MVDPRNPLRGFLLRSDMDDRLELTPHPRLYIGPDDLARLCSPPRLPYLVAAADQIVLDAASYAQLPPLEYRRDVHNAHLTRAREVQKRVVTLLARWVQTGDPALRAAALAHIAQIGQWEYWSWITWRQGNPAPDAIYDLSYGENSATLAIAYDWLHDTLSAEEGDLFMSIAHDRPFRSGLVHARPDGASWFGRPDSNWNTVCAGGLGMLALAMYDDAPEARELLPRVEESVAPVFQLLDQTAGGWPEGIGYWNYGMRYGFMYLLSHERAIGQAHPLMRLAGLRQTLAFPLDFCPHGQPCGFGDSNRWEPLPFHYRAAQRLDSQETLHALDAYLEEHGVPLWGLWPNAVEWLALHPGTVAERPRSMEARSQAKLYRGLDWGILADRTSDPPLHMTLRGGTTQVPHGHRDLLSFHCVVGRERLIASLGPAEYLDTTFSSRRDELFEISPASKNTILINGVGIAAGSALDCTELIHLRGAKGLRFEATTAMGEMYDGPAAQFCGRWALLLEHGAYLIVDRVRLPRVGRVESRLHTFAGVQIEEDEAVLCGEQECVRVAYACNVPALLCTATTAPTTPTELAATVLRWCTERQHEDVVMATLLSPGEGEAKVELAEDPDRFAFVVRGPGWQTTLTLAKEQAGTLQLRMS
jgi:hypothetical protein